jgi:hypothetical protein
MCFRLTKTEIHLGPIDNRLQVLRGRRGSPAKTALLDRKDLLARKVLLAITVLLDRLDPLDPLDPKALLDPLGLLDHKVLLVTMVKTVLLDRRDRKVS